MNETSDIVNTIEVMRKQLEDLKKALAGDATKQAVLKTVEDFDKKLFDVESKLLEPAQMTSDDKYFQQAYRVYMNLIWLNGEVGPGAGDVSGGADFRPTDTSVAVLDTIEKDLAAARALYKRLLDCGSCRVQSDACKQRYDDGRRRSALTRIERRGCRMRVPGRAQYGSARWTLVVGRWSFVVGG